jgi:peptidoglycan hydrolase-like protein with peptidoglycan-binding domain
VARLPRLLILGLFFLALLQGFASGAEKAATTSGKPRSASSTGIRAKQAARRAPRRKIRRAGSWRARGQQAMETKRIREIQQALIREHYLNEGEADGVWGSRSREAMARYQADHGWQAKVLPDSRALIMLGLGPDRSAIINPESLRSSIAVEGGGMSGAQD